MSDIPWLEKHRPRTLGHVVGNNDTLNRLKSISKHGNVPNLILSGPPGTGKTTSIHCLALDLLGEKLYKSAVLELNASDSRGIDVVRNRIKMFAQQKINLKPGQHKIIILDEADNMTTGAQQALRRTMEIYSSTTRFALACNISSKIIEPIQSRCCIIRYTRLQPEQIYARIKEIIKKENVTEHTEKGLQTLLFVADGDMRCAINTLQSTWLGFGKVDEVSVMKICDVPSRDATNGILSACLKGDIDEACVKLEQVMKEGYSPIDCIVTLFRVLQRFQMGERLKLDWISILGMKHMKVAE
eukprot:UN30337